MDARVEFFRNRIKNRLKELHPYMAPEKAKLYDLMLDDCDSYDELREMAELDMQFKLAQYIKGLEDELRSADTSI